jgi:hypothetical protein
MAGTINLMVRVIEMYRCMKDNKDKLRFITPTKKNNRKDRWMTH